MPIQQLRTVQTGSNPYGPLPPNFAYDLRRGYTALVGPNNAGKSALLQISYRTLIDDSEFGHQRVALILTDRDYVDPTTQTGSRTLAEWNENLVGNLRSQPLAYGQAHVGPARSELPRLLMHGDLYRQIGAVNELLVRFDMPTFRLQGAQEVTFEQVNIYLQGTGLRSIFPIVAALTNPNVAAIFIDEPEISLEPRLQKVLRDVLVDASAEKAVVVATHSHLFLRRDEVEANQVLARQEDEIVVRTLTQPRQLYDVTFDLLGSSTEDLFFPSNYLIVEGASDQVIVTKILALLGPPSPTVKVLSAKGIDAVRDAVQSVVRALVPLVVNDSPYAKRVVALIDQPADPDSAHIHRLERDLGNRLFKLDVRSIEEYVPEVVYERAGRSKVDDLARLDQLRDQYEQLGVLKREISDALAQALTAGDLAEISVVADAARKALELAPAA